MMRSQSDEKHGKNPSPGVIALVIGCVLILALGSYWKFSGGASEKGISTSEGSDPSNSPDNRTSAQDTFMAPLDSEPQNSATVSATVGDGNVSVDVPGDQEDAVHAVEGQQTKVNADAQQAPGNTARSAAEKAVIAFVSAQAALFVIKIIGFALLVVAALAFLAWSLGLFGGDGEGSEIEDDLSAADSDVEVSKPTAQQAQQPAALGVRAYQQAGVDENWAKDEVAKAANAKFSDLPEDEQKYFRATKDKIGKALLNHKKVKSRDMLKAEVRRFTLPNGQIVDFYMMGEDAEQTYAPVFEKVLDALARLPKEQAAKIGQLVFCDECDEGEYMGYGISPLTGTKAGLHILKPSVIMPMNSEDLDRELSRQVAHIQFSELSDESKSAWAAAVLNAEATNQRGVFKFYDQVYEPCHTYSPQQKFVLASAWLDDYESGLLTPEQRQRLEYSEGMNKLLEGVRKVRSLDK